MKKEVALKKAMEAAVDNLRALAEDLSEIARYMNDMQNTKTFNGFMKVQFSIYKDVLDRLSEGMNFCPYYWHRKTSSVLPACSNCEFSMCDKDWPSWYELRDYLHTVANVFDRAANKTYPEPEEEEEEEEEKWQPIETAPKDGSHILLYRPKIVFVGYYGGADSGWRHNAPKLDAIWPLPTHWAPLPQIETTSIGRDKEEE